MSIPVRYERWDTPAEGLSERVLALRNDEFLGANVTVPYKQAVLRFLDDLTEDVHVTGAANTIVKQSKRLVGHNTDVGGFRRALRDHFGYSANGKTAAVLGAGGGARAVVLALAQDGARHILVLNRTPARGAALVADLGRQLGVSLAAASIGPESERLLTDCDVVVNCTPVGLAGSGMEADQPIPPGWIPRHAVVVDIIANPLRTPFLDSAQAAGHLVLGGLPMLVHQGALSFSLWTGREAPLDVMMAAAQSAMAAGSRAGAGSG
jgi:shikimate dehydrogenase